MRWQLAVMTVLGAGACGRSGESRIASPGPRVAAAEPAGVVVTAGLDAAAAVTPGLVTPAPPPDPVRAATIELAFTGDINVGGYYADHYDPQLVEVHDPLVEIDAALASDVTLANLETTITRTLPDHGQAHAGTGNQRFVTIPERIAILPRHHISTVTLANNHQFDNARAGLVETPVILAELGITSVGAARADGPPLAVETIVHAGWRIGILAVTTKLNRRPAAGARPAIAFAEPSTLAAALAPLVAAARVDHDLVLVEIHWGVQYAEAPEPWQISAAHALVDAGADAVIGHHPHVLQAIERYRGAVIAYSLGNFLFPNGTEPVRQTGVLHLTFAAGDAVPACLAQVALDPAVTVRAPIYHPVPAVGADFATVRDRFLALSGAAPIGTTWRTDGSRFVTDAACPH